MRPPIYKPSGAALEYAEYGLNIYDSCPHGCTYCYAASMAKRFGSPWTGTVAVRPGLLDALHKQLAHPEWQSAGKLVHLCFTCDPYPVSHNTTATREVIRTIKESGNHVQILTKGNEEAQRDFDLLDGNDSFGVSLTGAPLYEWEPNAGRTHSRILNLKAAKSAGVRTWVSCEPVLCVDHIRHFIAILDFVDLWRIGKLNHRKHSINWTRFGIGIEALCKRLGRNYYIKEALRREMEG